MRKIKNSTQFLVIHQTPKRHFRWHNVAPKFHLGQKQTRFAHVNHRILVVCCEPPRQPTATAALMNLMCHETSQTMDGTNVYTFSMRVVHRAKGSNVWFQWAITSYDSWPLLASEKGIRETTTSMWKSTRSPSEQIKHWETNVSLPHRSVPQGIWMTPNVGKPQYANESTCRLGNPLLYVKTYE